MSYSTFLERKSQLDSGCGFDPVWMPEFLFDFQQALVEWSVVKLKPSYYQQAVKNP